MLKIKPFGICLVLLAVVGCSVKDPVTTNDVYPWIEALTVPGMIFTEPDELFTVSVSVNDAQGLDDIQYVRMLAFLNDAESPVWQDTLFDAGQPGDVIAGDGVFSAQVLPSWFQAEEGNLLFQALAIDLEGHTSDICDTLVVLVHGAKNNAPVLSNAHVPNNLTTANCSEVFLSVNATDLQGLDDIDSVFCDVYPPGSPISYFKAALNDLGVDGDSTAADGTFSAVIDLSDKLTDPPVITKVVCPDNLSRSNAEPILLSATVTDPQGLGDVKSVYFKTYKPDGTPASEQPYFSLYDDGDAKGHGDEIANDGTYSLFIVITPENEKGAYRFEFFAEDYTELTGKTSFRFQAKDASGSLSRAVVQTVTTNLGSGISDPVVGYVQVID